MDDGMVGRVRNRPAQVMLRTMATARRPFDRGKQHLLIACAPKSGSTLLIESLLEISGFERRNPLAAGGRHENDLYEPGLIDAMGRNTVAQVHVRASEHNVELLNRYRHQPIVLTRNLADTLVSLRDHMMHEGPRWSMLWADERFAERTPAGQLDQLVDLAAPWFVHFFVSWHQAAQDGSVEPVWLTYEEFSSDPARELGRVCAAVGIDADDHGIDRTLTVVAGLETRFNRGVVGRGADELSTQQHSRLDAMAAHYPWVDFSPIGL